MKNRNLRVTRNVALAVAASALFALVLSASAFGQTLEVWILDVDWAQPAVVNEFLDRFEAETGIRTERVSLNYGDLHSKFTVAVAAGVSPDLLFADSSNVLNWVAGGGVAPVDRYLEPYVDRFIPGKVRESSFAGKMYALPFDFQVRGLFWNADLFEAAGYDGSVPPATIADLDAYALKLTETRPDGGIAKLGFYPSAHNWGMLGWIWTFGSDAFDWETGRPTVNIPGNREVLEWMRTYADRWPVADFEAFMQSNGGTYLNAFPQGTVAMMLEGATYIPDLRARFPQLNFRTGRAPVPPGGRNGVWAGGLSIVVPKATRDEAAAGKLLSFFSQPELQEEWGNRTGRFPVHLDALFRLDITDPAMRAMTEQSEELNARPPYFGLFNGQLGSARTSVMRGLATPEEALETAEREVRAAMERDGFFEAWDSAR